MKFRRLLILAIVLLIFSTIKAKTIVKYFHFNVAPQGVVYFEVDIPKGVSEVKAVISYQTNHVDLIILGRDDNVICNTSTWNIIDNWKQDLECKVKVINNTPQGPGKWRIVVKGALHNLQINQEKNISGNLTVYISIPEKHKPVEQQKKLIQ